MKRKYLFNLLSILLLVLVVTGCNGESSNSNGDSSENDLSLMKKTMACTKEEIDEDGYKTNETVVITYNKTKVLKVKSTNITETDPEFIDFTLGFTRIFIEKFNEVEGIDAVYKKVDDNKLQLNMEIDYNRIDLEQMEKVLSELGDADEKSFYSSKDVTIEQFQEDYLEDYNCDK